MSKYTPLQHHLQRRMATEVPMTFEQIESVVGKPLPPSARYRAWWSNNAFNNVMTQAWLDAGYKTERVDMSSRKLVFRRVAADTPPPSSTDGHERLKALYGAMRGTITVNGDLTDPTGERWDAVHD